jgi:hypothetical protein
MDKHMLKAEQYKSVYESGKADIWNEKSAVRSKEKLSIVDPYDVVNSHLFSPSLTSYADHAYVAAMGPEAKAYLRARRLYDYLGSTERVEAEIVNRAIEIVMLNEDMPTSITKDFAKIYTDEAYHILMMINFKAEMEFITKIKFKSRKYSGIESILLELKYLEGTDLLLARLVSSIVTETLITGTLLKAADSRVYAPVREVLSDHARDEAYHHAAFTRLADCILPNLSLPQKEFTSQIASMAIESFLRPDLSAVTEDLEFVNLKDIQIEEIISSISKPEAVRTQMLESSRSTRKLFQKYSIVINI